MSCVSTGDLHICYGPEMEETFRKFDSERWCFKCRKRLKHFVVRLWPKEPSYYGPHTKMECEGCKEEHDQFPGCEFYRWEE